MIYTIESKNLKVDISDRGAQILSILSKRTGTEYLWQGDPAYWASRAPILFPICGRLTEGRYTYEGKTYEMPNHGFAKLSTFSVVAHNRGSITFRLTATPETLAMYPFDFMLDVTYTVKEGAVTTALHVENPMDRALPFSLGGHPGFGVPFCEGERFEDYYLEFPGAKGCRKLVMSPTCYCTGETAPFPLVDGRRLPLDHKLFDDDAIFLADAGHEVALRSTKNSRVLSMVWHGLKYIGFWHKPLSDAPYICIEPWRGVPAYDGKIDDFATKAEMLHLPAGGAYDCDFTVTITE